MKKLLCFVARLGRLAWLLSGLLASGLPDAVGAQEWTDIEQVAVTQVPGEPSIEVTRIGPIEVGGARRIDLDEATVDLAGRAWSYSRGDHVAILIKPFGGRAWSLAQSDELPAGGLFEISGIRFPDVGSYELVACLVSSADLPTSDAKLVQGCGEKALAISRKHLVRVSARPELLAAERSPLEVLSVGGVSLHPRGVTPVPSSGEILLRGQGLPAGTRVYVAIVAPNSDRCYLHGPARPGPQQGLFSAQGVLLEIPGDPRSAHLDLVAVASPELLAGPMSFRSLQQRDVQTSPTVEVMVDQKWEPGNNLRVPYLAVTRIGDHDLKEPPTGVLEVEPGDAIEVGQYERVPEGERLWILTRERGSSSWLAQGPAVLRGSRSPEDPRQGPPEVTWFWPSLRFAPIPGKTKRHRQDREEFEVLAVLATATLPDAWIDSSSFSGYFIQTVSQVIRVTVPPLPPLADLRISISRVGDDEADSEGETTVGAAERVEVTTRQSLPPTMRVYLARRKVGGALWTLIEAIPQGRSHVVPAISFIDPHLQEGARYQLVALVTPGVLPATQLPYDDLVHTAVAFSNVVTVRYETGGLSGLASRLARWWTGNAKPDKKEAVYEPSPVADRSGEPDEIPSEESPSPNTAPGGETMPPPISWTHMLLWILIIGALAFLAFLAFLAVVIALEWWLGTVSKLARSAANRIERGLKASREWFTRPVTINPAHFLLGMVMLVCVLYALVRYYLPLYGEAVSEVTGLSTKESAGLAFWLVLLTALAGTFLELSSQPNAAASAGSTASHPEGRPSLWLPSFLGAALVFLMLFQASFYFTFLGKTAGGLVALLGGVAFFLIAFIEAMAFFFITKLTLTAAGSLAVRLARAPFILVVLILRFVERLFDSIPRRKPTEGRSTPHPALHITPND